MNRREYMKRLEAELKRLGVSDLADILDEYEEHFDCRIQEGCSEEEIAARLGEPRELAAQFASISAEKKRGMTLPGRIFADIGVGLGSIVAYALGAVLVVFGCCCAIIGWKLVQNHIPLWNVIPRMSYASALLLGLALVLLSVVVLLGCSWYFSLLSQCLRAYGALRKGGERRVRPVLRCPRIFRLALIFCIILLIAGFIASAVLAGSIEFWHAWGWFGG